MAVGPQELEATAPGWPWAERWSALRRSRLWPVTVQAAGLWLVSRLSLLLFTYIAMIFMHHGFGEAGLDPSRSVHWSRMVSGWSMWDGSWYMAISTDGYTETSRSAFFPLYPALIHLLTTIFGTSQRIPLALLVSNLGSLAAFIALALMAAEEEGPELAPYAVKALASYPLAFFLAATYPESIFIALACLSMFCARRRSWGWAAGCAFLAGLTRPVGVVLAPALLWEYSAQAGLFQPGWRSRRPRLKTLVGGALVAGAAPLALGLYGAYLAHTFDDPLAFARAQTTFWKRELTDPLQLLRVVRRALRDTGPWSFGRARILVDLVPLVAFGALCLGSLRRQSGALTIYTLMVLALTIMTPIPADFNPLAAVARYLIIAFPTFLMIGRLIRRYPTLEFWVVSFGFLLQGVFTVFYLLGGPLI